MVIVKNRRVVIPFIDNIEVIMPVENTSSFNRGAYYTNFNFGETVPAYIDVPFNQFATEAVEIYVNGLRIINPRIRSIVGATEYEEFNVVENRIMLHFTKKHAVNYNSFEIIIERNPYPEQTGILIDIDNVQGSKSLSGISLFHEPIVMTRPRHGYARLDFYRKNLIYVPELNFNGTDNFSYCLINNHGQRSSSKCIFIQVGNLEEELVA